MLRPIVVFLIALDFVGFASKGESAEAPTLDQVEFFEKQVRPLLVEKCLDCHGAKKQQGALRLDSRAAMLKGNETGPALAPGKPQESRLVQVLRYANDDIQMPPTGKLPQSQIDVLTTWVEQGAPWPAGDATSPRRGDAAPLASEHWSFQPLNSPAVPAVKDAARVQTPIDRFIIAALEAKGMTLAPPADRGTFIRRATLDLWGLPPTYDEVQAFANDARPDAVNQLLDRLLASPRYGERWGRYWLDIARYADSKGYVFTEESRYPYAYTYRDYVIDAFNEDKPYNRFLREQLAADQLELGDNAPDLAALGFLTVGRRFLNNQNDIIDDRIDVVTRGLMGLTVGCARCHDHKYDPIPTADYYSLYGVFASSSEPKELPIIGPSERKADYDRFLEELAKREKALADYEQEATNKLGEETRRMTAAYLEQAAKPADSGREGRRQLVNGEPRPQIVRRWREFLANRAKQSDAIFGPWHQWLGKSADEFATSVVAWCDRAKQSDQFNDGIERINSRVRQAIVETPPGDRQALIKLYGRVLTEVHEKWVAHKKAQVDAAALPDPADEELRQVLYAEGTPPVLKVEEAKASFNRAERDKQRDFAKKIETLKATSPGAPPRAMVLTDNPEPMQPHIFVRGNAGRPGPPVPRQFLQVVAGPERKPFAHGSGRKDLADAIVDPTNPLTTRVLVNRVWQHHFGRGLVRSAGDFGIRGEEPTHPELLNHLALRFIASGWSVKELHRWIMSSAAYQQSSVDRPEMRANDPENRLLWKMPRQRLELEAMRDRWLAASGRLDETIGGRPFDSIVDANSRRRTVYGFINRNDLPNVFRAFDFADPDASAAERPQTSVPQQTLFAMNSPFVIEQAKQISADTNGVSEENERIAAIVRQVLCRDPTPDERTQAAAYLAEPGDAKLSPWERLAQVLLLTNEFLFVD